PSVVRRTSCLSPDTLVALAGVRLSSPTMPDPPPRLLDRVRAAVRARHFSRRTEKVYVAGIPRFILFHDKRHPADMGAPEVSKFLSALAMERNVAASTQNQALSGLLFLYREVLGQSLPWLDDVVRAKRPARLPVVLSREEVRAVVRFMKGPPRLMTLLLYGAGLRLLECAQLRVKDGGFAPRQLVIHGGKGDKDRVAPLPAVVATDLARHLETVKRQHDDDLSHGAGWAELPGALARKGPHAGRAWGWQWLSPPPPLYVGPEPGQSRRHHLHESWLQRAVKVAVLQAGLPKRASCHT